MAVMVLVVVVMSTIAVEPGGLVPRHLRQANVGDAFAVCRSC